MQNFHEHLLLESKRLNLQQLEIFFILKGMIPLEPKLISKIVQTQKITGIHLMSSKYLSRLRSMQGTNKSLSIFNSLDMTTINTSMVGQNRMSIDCIVKITGDLVANSERDLLSKPGVLSKNNTRWVKVSKLFDKNPYAVNAIHDKITKWLKFEQKKAWKYIETHITDDEDELLMKLIKKTIYVDQKYINYTYTEYINVYYPMSNLEKLLEDLSLWSNSTHWLDNNLTSNEQNLFWDFVNTVIVPLSKQMLEDYYLLLEKIFTRNDYLYDPTPNIKKTGEAIVYNFNIDYILSVSPKSISGVYCPFNEFLVSLKRKKIKLNKNMEDYFQFTLQSTFCKTDSFNMHISAKKVALKDLMHVINTKIPDQDRYYVEKEVDRMLSNIEYYLDKHSIKA